MAVDPFFHALVYQGAVSLTPSSEASGHIAGHAFDWSHGERTWWETNTTTSSAILIVDVGSPAPSLAGVYIRGLNINPSLGNVVLQANSTPVWTSPPINTTPTVVRNGLVKRIGGVHFFNADRSPVTYQYFRFLIQAGTPRINSATGYQVPLFLPVTSVTEVEKRPEINLDVRRATQRSAFVGGPQAVSDMLQRQVVMEFPWGWMWDPIVTTTSLPYSDEDNMVALAEDESVPVVVCWNLNKPHQSYLCRRTGSITIQSGEGRGATMPLVYEEII